MQLNSNIFKVQKYAAVIITGGSSGIGAAFIKSLSSVNKNALIINLSRTKPPSEISEKLWKHLYCDLSEPEDIEDACTEINKLIENENVTGPIMLINNSGFGSYGSFPHPNIDHHTSMVAVNVSAPIHLAGLLLPLLKHHGGSIINVASTAGFQPTPHMATYGASKAFLLHWSMALSEDLCDSNVHSLALCPGPTSATNFFSNAGFRSSPLPSGLGEDADKVVKTAWKALRRRKTLVVSGFGNKLISFFASKTPYRVVTWISGKILGIIRDIPS
jgi:uncharacterized protein